MVAGIITAFAATKFAAIVPDSSYFENHLPTRVAASVVQIGTGTANSQSPFRRVSMTAPAPSPSAPTLWLHATATAPTTAPARHPKIIIDTGERYLVQQNDLAIRYGIGVGRIGFQWSGVERISQREEWPDWRPPAEMVGRQPYLPRFMAGGRGNPLGARALYLGHSVFRIHGTNQPETIGHAVSSGCFRLANADVIDLYDRVKVGAKVLVRQSPNLS
jgi:lipoprotein-anchoring transpeptidase ErfK/SrfK